MSTVLLILHALLFIVSFMGLSALLSTRLQLNRFIAPCVAACGVIALLMLAGMAELLFPAVCLLYVLGFVGAIDALIHRHRPDWKLMLGMGGFIIFLVWRCYFCPLYRIDDVSHWGLVARHLLQYNRFPGNGDELILFQSYPLGSACWIYYVGRFIENSEGIYFVAQNFLMGILFLPLFALIRKKRNVLYPVCTVLFFAMIYGFYFLLSLQVDLLLGFFGIGIAAAIVYYRHDLRRALVCALPGMLAVTFIKNSGLFFALTSAALLLYAFHGQPVHHRKLLTSAVLLTPAFAFLLWELHIKLAFPDAQATKHAVSFSAYLHETLIKGSGVIAQIAKNQFIELFRPDGEKFLALAVLLPASVLLLCCAHKLPPQRAKRFRTAWLCAVIMYFVWYLLIFLMYVFSMPQKEALRLASISRYNATGLACLMGFVAILLIVAFQEVELLPRLSLWVGRLCPLCIVAIIALTAWPGGAKLSGVFRRDTALHPLRAALQEVRDECGIEQGDRIMAYCLSADPELNDASFAYYMIKYEYETDYIFMLTRDVDMPGQYYVGANQARLPAEMLNDGEQPAPDAQQGGNVFGVHGSHVTLLLDDPSAFIADELDNIDALLIFGDDADFENIINPLLAEHGGDIPVFRADLAMLS